MAKSFTDIENSLNMKLDGNGKENKFIEELQNYIAILIIPFKVNAKCVAGSVETLVKKIYNTVELKASTQTLINFNTTTITPNTPTYPEIINFFKFKYPMSLKNKLINCMLKNGKKPNDNKKL